MEAPQCPTSAGIPLGMFLVTYDLMRPHQDYLDLVERLRGLDGAVRYQQSSWIVRWAGNVLELRGYLRQFMDADDKLMVVHIGEAAWFDTSTTLAMIANGYPVIAA